MAILARDRFFRVRCMSVHLSHGSISQI